MPRRTSERRSRGVYSSESNPAQPCNAHTPRATAPMKSETVSLPLELRSSAPVTVPRSLQSQRPRNPLIQLHYLSFVPSSALAPSVMCPARPSLQPTAAKPLAHEDHTAHGSSPSSLRRSLSVVSECGLLGHLAPSSPFAIPAPIYEAPLASS